MSNARVLADRLAELLSRERDSMAEFLIALAAFDRQRVWAELGFSGLFWFLHRELKLSKSAAYCRKVAAEMIQKCPDIVAPLRDGRICLSSVGEVAKVLTVENVAEILPRFFFLSRREAAEVAATIKPVERPPSRDLVTVVPASPAIRRPAATPEAPLRDNLVVVPPCEPLLGVTPRAPTQITLLEMPLPTHTRPRGRRSSSRPASTSFSPGTGSVAESGRSRRGRGGARRPSASAQR
jgi:hypothetical protein